MTHIRSNSDVSNYNGNTSDDDLSNDALVEAYKILYFKRAKEN